MAQLTVLNNLRRTGTRVGDAERERIAVGLIECLHGTQSQVRFGAHDRGLYATDASLYQVEPIGVVVPGSVEDAVSVVRFCGERGVAMLPRGGGTSLAGQCTSHAVVIDLSGMCRGVRSLNLDAKTVYAEAGIGIDELNDWLNKQSSGLFFAPDPATTRQCAIGGAIGNNAAGARSVLYGRTVENLLSVDVALASGERLTLGPGAGRTSATALRLAEKVSHIVARVAPLIRERFPRTVRRNAGYALDMILHQLDRGIGPADLDLAPLLTGSEGTLALTLGATLKLHALPRARGLAVVAFASVEDAITATIEILKTGPSAVELLDDVVLTAARGNAECRRYLELVPKVNGAEAQSVLYVEYFAFDAVSPGGKPGDAIAGKFDELRARVGAAAPLKAYSDAASMGSLWLLRKAGEPLLHGLPGKRKPITFVEDNAVPPERLGEFVREFKKIVERHGTKAAYWAHASVGVLHVRPMIDIRDPMDRERMLGIAVEVADLARRCGGIMSGEHGDGRVRGPLLERFFGTELMKAMAEVKDVFDPKRLLNPGNIVGAGAVESITTNLRVDRETPIEGEGESHGQPEDHKGDKTGSGGDGVKVETYFEYADTEGFGHAVEQCNGAGVCRKRSGVMCPSYQATLDERHSTRGRGNALRLAITGQFSDGAAVPNFNDAQTINTLDLCLSCKACKSECPSNVDISRLKAEYTAQRFREQGGPTLKARMFGHVRVLNRLGSITPGLANWVNQLGMMRWLLGAVLDFSDKRTVPRFETPLHVQARRDPIIAEAMARTGVATVALFADCFTTYNDPRIGLASLRVLAKLGYAVRLVPGTAGFGGCCGRAMISTGLLEDAIRSADKTLEALVPLASDQGVAAIVACEPSCLSAIKDDWKGLKLSTPMADREAVAAKAWMIEEFVERAWESHPRRPTLTDTSSTGPVVLHGHCHQKSLWGVETSAKMLRRLVGDRLRVLDTTCCGMAGSFGYTKDRYELSMNIGELGLLPKVRASATDAVVCAPGTSCRHQIHDGTGREAVHPIELIDQLFGSQESNRTG